MTREEWLQRAAGRLTKLFPVDTQPPTVRVSCGFPRGGGEKIIGQCFQLEHTEDGVPQIYISPVLTELVGAQGVLPTLLHELVHACLPAGPKPHGGAFKKLALQVGLDGPMTATLAPEELQSVLGDIAAKLGPYPHAKPVMKPRKKSEKNRWIKLQHHCGYIARTTQQWLREVGAPVCPCDGTAFEVDDEN